MKLSRFERWMLNKIIRKLTHQRDLQVVIDIIYKNMSNIYYEDRKVDHYMLLAKLITNNYTRS